MYIVSEHPTLARSRVRYLKDETSRDIALQKVTGPIGVRVGVTHVSVFWYKNTSTDIVGLLAPAFTFWIVC